MKQLKLTFLLILLAGPGLCQISDGISTSQAKYRIVAVNFADESIQSTSNIVTLEDPIMLFAPDAFSPDGDNINDQFQLKGSGIDEIELMILNRWGEVVFQSTSLEHAWDGTYKGQPAPQGVYMYDVRLKNNTYGTERKVAGSVTLVR